MKKYHLLFALFLCFSYGCVAMGNKYKYDYSLLNTKTNNKMQWEDDKISIVFLIGETTINFRLLNKTDKVLKIIWDEASIIQFNEAQKIMHSGVKYINSSETQPPTVIPPNVTIDDLIIPSNNIYYISGEYGGWHEHDLFPTNDFNKEEYKFSILNSKGQKFSVYLPIQFEGTTLNYTFDFIITGVQSVKGDLGSK